MDTRSCRERTRERPAGVAREAGNIRALGDGAHCRETQGAARGGARQGRRDGELPPGAEVVDARGDAAEERHGHEDARDEAPAVLRAAWQKETGGGGEVRAPLGGECARERGAPTREADARRTRCGGKAVAGGRRKLAFSRSILPARGKRMDRMSRPLSLEKPVAQTRAITGTPPRLRVCSTLVPPASLQRPGMGARGSRTGPLATGTDSPVSIACDGRGEAEQTVTIVGSPRPGVFITPRQGPFLRKRAAGHVPLRRGTLP